MAVLEKIRNNGTLLVTVLAVALGGFVLSGVMSSGGSLFQGDAQTVLEIDGEDVSILDFDARLQTLQSQMESQGGQRLSDEQRVMLSNQLTQEYIGERALSTIAQSAGLSVTPAEVYALLTGKGVQPSMQARQFFQGFGIDINDNERVTDFISQMGEKNLSSRSQGEQEALAQVRSLWLALQRRVAVERLQQKVTTLLSRSYKVTDLDQEIAQGGGSRTVALVRTSAGMIESDSTTNATEAQIKEYYEGHKNFFLSQTPSTSLDVIYTQVVPSTDDYDAAAKEQQEAYEKLQEADASRIDEVLRGYSNRFFARSYATTAELQQMGLTDEQIEFVKTAPTGSVTPGRLVSDHYTLVKVVDKKVAPSALGVRILMLDSAKMGKLDSLQSALASGADFATLAREYSVDPQTAANGGLLSFPNQYGMMDSTLTEMQAMQANLDTIYRAPVGSVIRIASAPNTAILVKSVNPQPAVEKYQIAYLDIPVEFSSKTYNDRYAEMNKILGEGGTFDQMAEKARSLGFNVAQGQTINTATAQVANIPSSRSVITWALQADKGATSDKLYTCGTDYLVIPHVVEQIPAGALPLSIVKDQIAARLGAENRVEAYATKLSGKGLTTLESYATELNTKIDTLVGVDYIVRGSEPAKFNGVAMTTALGKLSKPFAAGNEVMVLSPISTQPSDASSAKAQSRQLEADKGRSIGYQALYGYIQKMKVKDQRAKFYQN